IDGRSDLYSLGIVAYEMISGRRPFDAESPMEALTKRLTQDPEPLGSSVPDLPSDLALAVDRCLKREPDQRWPDTKSLRDALLPPSEEADDSLPGRLFRIGKTLAALDVLGIWYLALYIVFVPDFRMAPRVIGAVVMAVVTMIIMLTVGTLGLRSHGFDGR